VKAIPQSNATSAEVSRPTDTAYTFGAFRLVPKERKLLLADQPIQLGSRAFEILVALVERAGTVVPGDELMRLVWPGVVVEEANLRVQLGSLRKVLARGEGAVAPSRQCRSEATVSFCRSFNQKRDRQHQNKWTSSTICPPR
jgi:DNA-binding response OmpR family regulator